MIVRKLIKYAAFPLVWLYDAATRVAISVSPRLAVQMSFFKRFFKLVDFNNPRTLNEKIQWLMLNTDISIWSRLADKYQVKEYLSELGLSQYVPKLYGVYECAEDINLAVLPQKFVLKCNHDCGSWKIVDKTQLSEYQWMKIKSFLNKSVNKVFGKGTVELHYMDIPRRIIAEEYIENDNAQLSKSIIDYKLWCLDGEPYCCFTVMDRDYSKGSIFAVYDIPQWNHRADWLASGFAQEKMVSRPEHLDEMINVARRIAKPFPQVRIDFYEAGGKVYVGELTFTSEGGKMDYFSEKAQLEMGCKITLPKL